MHFLILKPNHKAKVRITRKRTLTVKLKVQLLDTVQMCQCHWTHVSLHQVGNEQACTQANRAANTVPVHDMPSRRQKFGMQGV